MVLIHKHLRANPTSQTLFCAVYCIAQMIFIWKSATILLCQPPTAGLSTSRGNLGCEQLIKLVWPKQVKSVNILQTPWLQLLYNDYVLADLLRMSIGCMLCQKEH